MSAPTHPAIEAEFFKWQREDASYDAMSYDDFRAGFLAALRLAVEVCKAERRDDGMAQRIEAEIGKLGEE